MTTPEPRLTDSNAYAESFYLTRLVHRLIGEGLDGEPDIQRFRERASQLWNAELTRNERARIRRFSKECIKNFHPKDLEIKL